MLRVRHLEIFLKHYVETFRNYMLRVRHLEEEKIFKTLETFRNYMLRVRHLERFLIH